MNEMLAKLIETDKKARAMVIAARQYNSDTMNNLSTDIATLRESYMSRAENRLHLIHEDEDRTTANADHDMEERYKKLTRMLEDTYAQRRDQLCNELFERCVGR